MTNYGNNFNQGYQAPPAPPTAPGGNAPTTNGGNRTNSGFDNHARIQLIGRIVKDPESKMVNNSKVATAKIAVNHKGGNQEADFWFVEIWGNEGQDSMHNFLVNHCPKGRRVFIEGTPLLKQGKNDNNGGFSVFPTVKVSSLIGLDSPSDSNKQAGAPQGNFQAPQGNFQAPPQNNFQAPPAAPPVGQYAPQGNFQGAPSYNQAAPTNYQAAPAPQYGAPGAPNGEFPTNPPGGYGAPAGMPNGGFQQR